MLEKLTIKNFQAHKLLEIDFNPHVTTIVGPSDVGKSAVIRALIWLATNKPAGDSFIREGSKTATAILLADGQKIVRQRGSKNLYKMDGRELEAFERGVPPEVSETLNLSPVNFQGQHDSPFWFGETAGEVSRQLNRIVDLEIIDTTMASLEKALRASRERVKVGEERAKEARARRSALKHIRTVDEDLTEVEALHVLWTESSAGTAKLNDLVSHNRKYEIEADRASTANSELRKIVKMGSEWALASKQASTLRESLSRIEMLAPEAGREIPDPDPLIQLFMKHWKLEEQTDQLELLIEKARTFEQEAAQPIPDLGPLLKLREKASDTCKRWMRLAVLLEALSDEEALLRKMLEEAKAGEDVFNMKMEEEDVCPLCGRSGPKQ